MAIKTEFTAYDVYQLALVLLAEKEARAKDYNIFYPSLMNIVLAESFNANNVIRMKDGLEKLEKDEMPFITTEDAKEFVIPYDAKLIREVLVFGLAAYLVLDDDKSIAASFSQQYESRLARYNGAAIDTIQIKDVY